MNIKENLTISRSMTSRIDILRRACHVLALAQNGNDPCDWNKASFSRLFVDENLMLNMGEGVSEKQVATSLDLIEKMELPIDVTAGARRISLDRELNDEEQILVLRYYMHMVVKEIGINDYLRKYIRGNKHSLWMLGRMYFARVRKLRVLMNYCPSADIKEYTVHPYDWIYRSDAIYLVAFKEGSDHNPCLFRLDRIREIKVLDIHFPEDVPDAEELFRYSLGPFIGRRTYKVVIEYPKMAEERIEEDFGHIELTTTDAGPGMLQSSFAISDLGMLCRIVFPYGGSVRIVSPVEAREEMMKLLRGNVEKYQM